MEFRLLSLCIQAICLHPNMTALQMISLDYAIAIYPLLLILLTYAFVTIHDRFAIVQLLWKPVMWMMLKINCEFRVKRTLIKSLWYLYPFVICEGTQYFS